MNIEKDFIKMYCSLSAKAKKKMLIPKFSCDLLGPSSCNGNGTLSLTGILTPIGD